MSGPRRIKYHIPTKGKVEDRQVTVETENFVGTACQAATQELIQNLTNGATETKYKDEYYKDGDGTNVFLSED